MAEDADGVEDSPIGDFGGGELIAEVEMAANPTAGFAGVEVAGVAVAFEYHVAGLKT